MHRDFYIIGRMENNFDNLASENSDSFFASMEANEALNEDQYLDSYYESLTDLGDYGDIMY